jgi:hypothetical protein
MSVTFTASTLGPTASSFTLTSSSGVTGSGASSPLTLSELVEGTYTYTVSGVNANGTGPSSATSNSVVVASVFAPSGAYDSIATVTVGATSVESVSFTSIPQTYQHLQLRCYVKVDSPTWIPFSVNNDTNTQRATHLLSGGGASVSAGAGLGATTEGNYAALMGASQWGTIIVDVLDYANTNKNKTTRALSGVDNNGSGNATFTSVLHVTNGTTSVTSVKFDISQYGSGAKFVQYSSFALYGIKG